MRGILGVLGAAALIEMAAHQTAELKKNPGPHDPVGPRDDEALLRALAEGKVRAERERQQAEARAQERIAAAKAKRERKNAKRLLARGL